MRTKNLCAVLSLAVAGIACESGREPAEETVAEAPKEEAVPTSAEAKPAEPEPPKTLEAEALANHYVGCWNSYNDRKWDQFGSCFDEKATSSIADSERPALSGRQAIVDASGKELTKAFTNAKGSPEIVLVNGRRIAAVALLTGTNDGALTGPGGKTTPATNKQFGQHIFHAVTLDAENQVTEETIIQDEATFASQLGFSDQPGRAVEAAPITGSPNIVIAKNDATEKANVDIVKQAILDMQKENLTALEAILSDDVVLADQTRPDNVTGKKAVSAGSKQFFAAMSDIEAQCDDIWGAGPYVVAECKLQGTNDGDMGKQFKKTGKPFDVVVAEVAKLQDGKVTELWRFMNSAGMARQLGLAPAAAPAETVAEKAAPEPAKPTPAGANPAAPSPVAPKDRPASGQQ